MPGFRVFSTEVGVPLPKKVLLKHQWIISKLGPVNINPESPAVYAKDVSLPRVSFDEETVEGGVIKYKFAKLASWDDVKVTFYDTVGLLSQLNGWLRQVYTTQNGLGVASDYKRTSRFSLVDGNNVVLTNIELMNSWPKHISYGDLTYTESDAKLVDLTLSYDFANIN
jgi:hypothetical protein